MANNRCTYQQIENVSINKKSLADIAVFGSLSKSDYRVLLILFTELNGWKPSSRSADPLNFKKIDKESISITLGMTKKDVKKSIDRLIEQDLLEQGSSDTVEKGYRFTF